MDMVRIDAQRAFRWSPDGITVNEYPEGEQTVPARCAEVAIAEGWAVPFEDDAEAKAAAESLSSLTSPDSPTEEPSSASPEDQASPKGKSKK